MSLKSIFAFDDRQGVNSAAFEMIMKFIPSGVIVVEKTSGKIAYVNDRFIEITGIDPCGLSLREYALSMANVRRLNNTPFLYEQLPLAKALFCGKTTHNQKIIVHKADKTKLTLLVNAKPLIDNGKITGAAAIIEDITELKKTEEELKQVQIRLQEYANTLENIVEERTQRIMETEQNYRELFESFGEAFIFTDWDLNIIHWNKAASRVTSVPAKDAVGKKIYDVMPEMMTIDTTSYSESLKQKRPARFMMNVVSRETKKPAVFEVSAYPSTQGITVIVEDKTEEEETKRLSTIGQVAGMVGHDIRNPLQAILSDIFLLKDALKKMPEIQTKMDVSESLEGIEENVEYINKIVMDLQNYVKPVSPTLRETDLKLILADVLSTRAIPKSVQVFLLVQPEAREIVSDPDLLKRILANLINNAVQAMTKGGKLSIQVAREGNNSVLAVEDTGIGIPEDIRSKIFTPLFTTKSKGQGFGLAAVKRMVEALSGTVNFESQVGKGTRFVISLPDKEIS